MTEAATIVPPDTNSVLRDVEIDPGAVLASSGTPFYASLTHDCPVDSVTFGNVTFHKAVDRHLPDGRVQSTMGQLLSLSDDQVELCKAEMKLRVLRIFYEQVDGEMRRKGQQDVAFARWQRAGVGPDGKAFLGPDGKAVEQPVMVRVPTYVRSRNDVAWNQFCRLVPVTPEFVRTLEMIQGRSDVSAFMNAQSAPNLTDRIEATRAFNSEQASGDQQARSPVDVVAETRDYNAKQSALEQSLAAEAGITKRGGRRGPSGTAARED